jgi:AAA domain
MRPTLIEPKEVIRRVAHERTPALVVASPPGGGKTRLAVAAAAYTASLGDRAVIATLSNIGADDVALRVQNHVEKHRLKVPVIRLIGQERRRDPTVEETLRDIGPVRRISNAKELPNEPSVTITTLAKLATSAFLYPFDFCVFDEAFLASFADLLAAARAVNRVLLIGDPGQIGPVVEANVAPWSHLGWGPHKGAGIALMALRRDISLVGLKHSFRLQPDIVSLVAPVFYDKYPFDSQATPPDLSLQPGTQSPLDTLIDQAFGGPNQSLSAGLIPGRCDTIPDRVVAESSVQVAARIMHRGLHPDKRIAIIATRREQVAITRDAAARLYPVESKNWAIETSDRCQGLEYDIVITQYPLGGPTDPTAFDLLAGRLCVILTRSRGATILLAREDVPRQLGATSIREEAGDLSSDDPSYIGRRAHRSVWRWMLLKERIVRLPAQTSW